MFLKDLAAQNALLIGRQQGGGIDFAGVEKDQFKVFPLGLIQPGVFRDQNLIGSGTWVVTDLSEAIQERRRYPVCLLSQSEHGVSVVS